MKIYRIISQCLDHFNSRFTRQIKNFIKFYMIKTIEKEKKEQTDRNSERNKEIVDEIGRTGYIRSNRAASFGERSKFLSRRFAAIGRALRAVERRSDANGQAASDISGSCEANETPRVTFVHTYIYARARA